MTVKLFYQNPYQIEFEAKVVEVSGNSVVLDQTCFFPQGGGQVGDTGEINGIKVIDTVKSEDKKKIIHVLEKPATFKVGDKVKGKIDWERRYKIMKLHSASHIVMHFMKEVFGGWCVPFAAALVDDRKDRSTYTFREPLDKEKLKLVEKKTNEFITRNLEIKTWADAKNPDYRYWKCGEIELPCGGTAVKNTKEIGKIIVEKGKKAGTGKEKIETMLVENVEAPRVEVKQKSEPVKKEIAQIKKEVEGEKSLFWADQIAEKVIERSKKDGKKIVIRCGQTPSGGKHIGNLNDVIRAYFVYKSVIEKGYKAEFVHSTDDRDPLKDIPARLADLNGEWHPAEKFPQLKEYLGHPLCRVPDPFGCCKSWSEHFTKVWEIGLNQVNMFPKIMSNDEYYKQGKFNPYIKMVFEKIEPVGKIIAKFQETKGAGYIPFDAICPKCGMLANVSSFDLKKGTVHFVCGGKAIKKKKSEGCGFAGDVPFREGKLQWRFEWPAQWGIEGTTFEPFGKDHFEGSWKSGQIIAKEIYGFEPPIPYVYEFFLVDGGKMSASKGNVYIVQDVLKVMEPEPFAYFYTKRPGKQRDLTFKDLSLIREYETAEKIYFGAAKAENEREEKNIRRSYELATPVIPKRLPRKIPFDFAAQLVQIYSKDEDVLDALKSTGHINNEFTKEDLESAKKRLELARNWVKMFAPEEVKIKVVESVSPEIRKKLSSAQISALKMLASVLEKKKLSEDELYEEFKRIIAETKLSPQDFYRACYLAIIGKERGPKLAGFIIAVGREKAEKVLKSV